MSATLEISDQQVEALAKICADDDYLRKLYGMYVCSMCKNLSVYSSGWKYSVHSI